MAIFNDEDNNGMDLDFFISAKERVEEELQIKELFEVRGINPKNSEIYIDNLITKYLGEMITTAKEIATNANLHINRKEAQELAYSKVMGEIKFLNRRTNETLRAKECKWCKKFFEDDDDFCSPECLEKYANEYLAKKDLPEPEIEEVEGEIVEDNKKDIWKDDIFLK